jgi:hypothetical protein
MYAIAAREFFPPQEAGFRGGLAVMATIGTTTAGVSGSVTEVMSARSLKIMYE